MALRSDAYQITDDFRIVLAPECKGVPPNIKLDGRYKFVDGMETMVPEGAPSLIGCQSLTVEGEVVFEKGVVLQGGLVISNGGEGSQKLGAGTYGSADGKEKIVLGSS